MGETRKVQAVVVCKIRNIPGVIQYSECHKECVGDKSDNKDHRIETPGVAHFILEACSMENLRLMEVVKTIEGYDTLKVKRKLLE